MRLDKVAHGNAIKTPRMSVGVPRLFVGEYGGAQAVQEAIDRGDTRSLGIVLWRNVDEDAQETFLATAMTDRMTPNGLYEYITRIVRKELADA